MGLPTCQTRRCIIHITWQILLELLHLRNAVWAVKALFCMSGSGWGEGVRSPPPPLNHKHIAFLNNIGPDLLKTCNCAKPAFNVRPSSARRRNAILMAFLWRAHDGPLKVAFGPSPFISVKTGYLWRNFLDPRMFSCKFSEYQMVGAANQNLLRILWSLLSMVLFFFSQSKRNFFCLRMLFFLFLFSDVT